MLKYRALHVISTQHPLPVSELKKKKPKMNPHYAVFRRVTESGSHHRLITRPFLNKYKKRETNDWSGATRRVRCAFVKRAMHPPAILNLEWHSTPTEWPIHASADKNAII